MDPLPITIIPSPELMAAIWIVIGILVCAFIIYAYVELHTMMKNDTWEKEEPVELQDPDPHGFTSSAETKPLRVVRRKK